MLNAHITANCTSIHWFLYLYGKYSGGQNSTLTYTVADSENL